MPAYIYPDESRDHLVTRTGHQTITGRKIFQSPDVASTPLTVQGIVSQTADIFQWKNSAGTVLGWFRQDGAIFGPLFAPTRTNGTIRAFVGTHETEDTGVAVYSVNASSRVLLVRGATSQVGHLQEWQNSVGFPFTTIDRFGRLTVHGAPAEVTRAEALATRTLIITSDSGEKGLIIRGRPSQNVNLQEWQDSSGTAIGSVSQDSILTIRSINLNNLYNGFQPVLYLTAHPTQSANMTEWRNSAGTVISSINAIGGAVFKNTSTGQANGNYGTDTALNVTKTQGLGNTGNDLLDLASFGGTVTNTTRLHLRLHRQGGGGTDHGSANLQIIRFTDVTGQQYIEFAGNGRSNYHCNVGAAHYFYDSNGSWAQVNGASYVTNSTFESKTSIESVNVQASSMPKTLVRSSVPTPSSIINTPIIDRFKKLNAVSYLLKDGSDTNNVLHSFVVEEAVQALPEIVSVDADGTPVGINNSSLAVITASVVQNLLARIEALEAK